MATVLIRMYKTKWHILFIFQAKKPFKYNQYATKKTFAQGLLDIGLLMANASQLKSLIDLGPDHQDYFWASIVNGPRHEKTCLWGLRPVET